MVCVCGGDFSLIFAVKIWPSPGSKFHKIVTPPSHDGLTMEFFTLSVVNAKHSAIRQLQSRYSYICSGSCGLCL